MEHLLVRDKQPLKGSLAKMSFFIEYKWWILAGFEVLAWSATFHSPGYDGDSQFLRNVEYRLVHAHHCHFDCLRTDVRKKRGEESRRLDEEEVRWRKQNNLIPLPSRDGNP